MAMLKQKSIGDRQLLEVDADPNGVDTATMGSLALRTDGALYRNTAGTDVWDIISPQPACSVYASGAQTVGDSAMVPLEFDAEDYDPGGMHDTVTNNNRVTVAVAGKYSVVATVGWAADAVGERAIAVQKNGAIVTSLFMVAKADTNAHTITALGVEMAATDYFDVIVFQSSGGNLDTATSPQRVAMQVARTGI